MDFGATRYHKVIGELNSEDLLIIRCDEKFDKLPDYILLEHDWWDTFLHVKIGEIIAATVIISTFFVNLNNNGKYILLILGLLSLFLLSMNWLRKPLQFRIELHESFMKIKSHKFNWLDIDKMYKIRTSSSRNPKYGIKLILNDQREINIDLALRKSGNSSSDSCLHLIYLFWKRKIERAKE